MAFLALLPFGCLFFLFIILFNRVQAPGIYTAGRRALLYAILILSVYCGLITEILSAFRSINFSGILLSWAIPFVLLAAYCFQKKLFVKSNEFFRSLFKLTINNPICWFIGIFLIISFVLAVLYPANNYDSMTYHMARVAHWQQQQTVSHYPTHVLRQLILQPFAEWVILHFQTLVGSDRLANTVQLFFFAGCLLVVSLVTKSLGGNRAQQLLAMLLTCVIPMAAIESNTTQNDIVVSFFVLAFIFFSIWVMRRLSISNLIPAGISLGLAWLTKGTAYIYSMLFIAWYLVLLITYFREPLKNILSKALLLAIVPVIALTINSTHFYRNTFLTGSPLGNASAFTGNEGHALKSLAMVSFKNALNHMPVTRQFKKNLSARSFSWGIDIDDPKYNYNTIDWMMEGISFHEDYAQNFVHTLLVIIASIVFLSRRKLYRQPLNMYTAFFFTMAGTGVLFCLLLKWQPWSNRLETPLFMLCCIFLGMEIMNWKKILQYLFVLPAMAFGTAALLLSENHPLLPPTRSILTQPYTSFMSANEVLQARSYLDEKPYTKLGIFIGADSRDYYYYKELSKTPAGKRRILKHVFVNNGSEIYLDDFVPDAIIYEGEGPKKFNYQGKEFVYDTTFDKKIELYISK